MIFSDISILAACYAIFGLIGLPFCLLLRTYKYSILCSPILGYSISGIIITIFYSQGIPISNIFYLLTAIGLVIFFGALLFFIAHKNNYNDRKSDIAIVVIIFVGWLLGVTLLMLPKWIGGIQFSIFQGNQWDQFNYITSSLVYTKVPYSELLHATDHEFLINPLLTIAQGNLSGRPTVMLLYSFVGQLYPKLMYETHYTFLIFFYLNAITAIVFLLVNILDTISRKVVVLSVLISLSFVIGFWGQYIFDINAWSQIASIPGLILLLTISIVKITQNTFVINNNNEVDANNCKARFIQRILFRPYYLIMRNGDYIVFILLFSSIFYIYPENLLFHCLALGIAFIVALIIKYKIANIWKLILCSCIGFSIGLFYYDGTIGFVIGQLKMATSSSMQWWAYFDRFYLGNDVIGAWFDAQLHTMLYHPKGDYGNAHTIMLALTNFRSSFLVFPNCLNLLTIPVNILAGLFGIYFLAPMSEWDILIRILAFVLLTVLIFCVIYLSVKFVITSRQAKVRFFSLFLVGMFTVSIILLLKGQLWSAGKGISFLSPYLIVFLFLPLFGQIEKKYSILKVSLILLLCSQLLFGFARPLGATHSSGIHYSSPPYPSSQYWNNKMKLEYDCDVSKLTPLIEGCSLLKISVPDVWLQHLLMLYAYSNDKSFYHENVVYTSYGVGREIGYQSIKKRADCTITVKESTNDRKETKVVKRQLAISRKQSEY